MKLTDEQIDRLIAGFDTIAFNYNPSDYGLPTHESDEIDKMRDHVRAWCYSTFGGNQDAAWQAIKEVGRYARQVGVLESALAHARRALTRITNRDVDGIDPAFEMTEIALEAIGDIDRMTKEDA